MIKIADLVKKMACRGGTQTTLIEVPEADKILSRKNVVTTQTEQKLKKILGGITVGDKLPGTVEDLENEMTTVVDDYLKAGGMQCAKEHRLYVNAHLLFFFSKCTEKQPVPAVINQRQAQKQARRVSQGQQRRTVFQVPQPAVRQVCQCEGGAGKRGQNRRDWLFH